MTKPHLRKGCPQSYIFVNMRTLHGNLYTYLMREPHCRMGNVWYWKNLLIEARKYYWAQTLAHIPKDKEVFCGLKRKIWESSEGIFANFLPHGVFVRVARDVPSLVSYNVTESECVCAFVQIMKSHQ